MVGRPRAATWRLVNPCNDYGTSRRCRSSAVNGRPRQQTSASGGSSSACSRVVVRGAPAQRHYWIDRRRHLELRRQDRTEGHRILGPARRISSMCSTGETRVGRCIGTELHPVAPVGGRVHLDDVRPIAVPRTIWDAPPGPWGSSVRVLLRLRGVSGWSGPTRRAARRMTMPDMWRSRIIIGSA